MKRNLLLTPGPTQIPPYLCAELGKPIIHHRTPQFQQAIKEVVEGLKFVLQTKNDVYLFASSGTGAMEASVINLLSVGDKAICVEGGKFGERWTELCKAYGIVPVVIKVPWGKDVDPNELKKVLDANKDVKVVFITQCETSTGVTANVKAIGEIVKDTNAVLVVDAVSGLGVIDLKTDQWFADVVVSGSHKGFMLPPGVSFASVSPKAYKLVEACKTPRYYFDFRKAKKAMEKIDTPFTPAIGIVLALQESLKRFKTEGLESIFGYYSKLAKGTRAGMKALGLTLFPDESCASNALTAVKVPEGIDGEKVMKIMRDTHGVSVAGGQGEELKGKVIRMAHMGCVDEYDILTGISCLEKTLKELGYKFTLGAGVAAAQKVFNE